MPETYDADSVDTMEPAARWLGMLVRVEFIEAKASALLNPFKD